MNTCASHPWRSFAMAVVLSAVASVHRAAAVDLLPGATQPLVGVPGGAGPGTVIHDELIDFEIRNLAGALLYRGRLQDRVVRIDATMTYAFEHSVRDTQPGLNGIVRTVESHGYQDFLTDVEFSTTSVGTIGPSQARRTVDGNRVAFDFLTSPLFSGGESRFMFAKTEANAFVLDGRTVITLTTGESVTLKTVRPTRNVEPGCHEIDFSDLALGTRIPQGGSFTANGVLMHVEPFYLGPGGCANPWTTGQAGVGDAGNACGDAQELTVGNVNVRFDYGVPLLGLVIHYGEYGGNVNFEVNGDCVNLANFADLPPELGGVAIDVKLAGAPGQGCGRIELSGPILRVAIGGQELWIDDIQCRPDPCSDDLEPPVAEITSPSPLVCVCDPVAVIGTASDANLEGYVLEYRSTSAATWNLIAEGTTPVVNGLLGEWDAAALPQGFYTLRLTVRDVCGHSDTAVQTVWLGTEFDSLELRSPPADAILGRRVCLDGTVWDNFCFDQYVAQYRPPLGLLWQPVEPMHPVYTSTVINDPIATWDTIAAGVPDGDYQLRVRALDDCGHDAEVRRDVVVDNTAPIAVITAPDPCTHVEGRVAVVGTAADANLAGWVVQYTGGDAAGWITIGAGNRSVVDDRLATWDTTELRPCAYTLRLIVTDQAVLDCNGAIHHQSEYTVSVNVGFCALFDADEDGDVDLFDYHEFKDAFSGPGG